MTIAITDRLAIEIDAAWSACRAMLEAEPDGVIRAIMGPHKLAHLHTKQLKIYVARRILRNDDQGHTRQLAAFEVIPADLLALRARMTPPKGIQQVARWGIALAALAQHFQDQDKGAARDRTRMNELRKRKGTA